MKIKTAKKVLEVAEANYKLEPFANASSDFKKAESAYNTELKTFNRKVDTFKTNLRTTNLRTALEDFEVAQSAYEESVLRKNINKTNAEALYNAAQTAYPVFQGSFC